MSNAFMALFAALAAKFGWNPQAMRGTGQFSGSVIHHALTGRSVGKPRRSSLRRRLPARCRK